MKNYKVDLMFVWNKQVGEKYKKFFDTNYIVSGWLSNSMVKKNLKKDNCLIYIFEQCILKKMISLVKILLGQNFKGRGRTVELSIYFLQRKN